MSNSMKMSVLQRMVVTLDTPPELAIGQHIGNIPTCYNQAVTSTESNKCQKAMNDEMETLEDNATYDLVPRPEGM